MSEKESRGDIEAVHAAVRDLASQMTWHSHAVAAAANLHPTDLEILDLLDQYGDLTAGRLAELSGLTTGAITGVVDRLTAAQHVERITDQHDRRKVVITKTTANQERMWKLYGPLTTALDELLGRYSPAELAAIADYAERAATAIATDAARLRSASDDSFEELQSDSSGLGPGPFVLTVERGLSKVTLSGSTEQEQLIVGKFWRTSPTIRQSGNRVALAYRSSVFGSLVLGARMTLRSTGPWEIDIDGGLSYAQLDLSLLSIESFRVDGAVKAVSIELPEPAGVVPLVLTGDCNECTIHLPKGTSASVLFSGSLRKVSVEGTGHTSTEAAAIGKGTRANNRYDIRVLGNANKVSVSRIT